MYLSYTKFAGAFALLSAVMADPHGSCTCHNGDSYNWRMTTVACAEYNANEYPWGGTSYDTPSGRCYSKEGGYIEGDPWEFACKTIATRGFQCADGRGTCFADPDTVAGWCD
ncbi:hypothetical protein K4K58_000094 [Colletotrichum sp. SAR11_239]|nr:hypothetical protein K4K58_000094 [Colletotrichum sp. SAR11_239]